MIPAINIYKGDLVTSNWDINKVFLDFFDKFYKSEVKLQPGKLEALFSEIVLPELSTGQEEDLDGSITEQKVKAAIVSMKTEKSPWFDGFPAEYYKQYADVLAPTPAKGISRDIILWAATRNI